MNLLHQIALNLGDIVLIKGNPFSGLARPFTADEALVAGDVVYLSGAGLVKKALSANRSQTIGVAIEDAALGEDVPILFAGKATVIADGAISPGDPVAASDLTAGRVVSLLNHSHSISSAASHTHSISSVAAHTHSITSGGDHTHSISTTGSYYHMITPQSCPAGHSGCQAGASLLGRLVTATSTGTAGAHNHGGATGSAGAHSHGGATGSAGAHSHGGSTGTIGNAQILGKAITSAAAAGESIDILVSLAG